MQLVATKKRDSGVFIVRALLHAPISAPKAQNWLKPNQRPINY
jgi:hypothetical protein